jgi:2-iminoacetate synthase
MKMEQAEFEIILRSSKTSEADSFRNVFDQYDWKNISEKIQKKTSADVVKALRHGGFGTLDDFMALISPAASNYLEEMAQLSRTLTRKRFGNVIQMYIPMYVSNECQNICTYCGFSLHNKIERITLTDQQIMDEVKVIKQMKYDHLLIVSGEATKTVGVDYFEHVVRLIRPFFSSIMFEVQPLSEEEYEGLISLGVSTVLVYQETYNEAAYKNYHPKGKKSNFNYRLETPDRLGKAGVHRMGLGALLGLENWRTDSFFTALHLNYLEKKFWQTKFSVSFPRLRPAAGYFHPNYVMSDRELLQLICAYRIFNENLELSLSTRESPKFRDHVATLGITSMSAGSKTNPGGYSHGNFSLEQFEISDERSPEIIAEVLNKNKLEAVWKDWDKIF